MYPYNSGNNLGVKTFLVMFALLSIIMMDSLKGARVSSGETVSVNYPEICDLPFTSAYVLKFDATTQDEGLLTEINSWPSLIGPGYENATGYPLAKIYLETDIDFVAGATRRRVSGPNDSRRMMMIYPYRNDDSKVVMFFYTTFRLAGRHEDRDLHNHPDCPSGVIPRENVEGLLETLEDNQE